MAYPTTATARRTASTDTATSASSVDQLLTEARITARSRHCEPDIHAVPSARTRAVTSRVRASSPKAQHTWVKTTSLRTSAPSMPENPLARALALAARRSTSAAIPTRPRPVSYTHLTLPTICSV